MNQNVPAPPTFKPLDPRKFRNPELTANGERRASVALKRLETLWFNTGTLCNIECANCYIESSPTNDRLVYLTAADVAAFLDEAEALSQRPRTVGFTGGEPFMNPDIAAILQEALARGYDTLVLTNAMRPMMRPHVQAALVELNRRYGEKLTLRVSLDHWRADLHDEERGIGSFDETLKGLRWLRDQGISICIAGRSRWDDSDRDLRAGYAALFARENIEIDVEDHGGAGDLSRNGRARGRARDHRRLLAHSEQESRRRDVRIEPHDRQTQRRGRAGRRRLHAAAV